MTTDKADVFLVVVTSDAPIPLSSFPTRQPGAQARRKQAAKQLIGAQRLKASNDSACTVVHSPDHIHNIPPIAQYDMYPCNLAQGEVKVTSTSTLKIDESLVTCGEPARFHR